MVTVQTVCPCQTARGARLWLRRYTHSTIFHLAEAGAWRAMRARCRNHPNYAGRGITVCKQWMRSFDAFFTAMGPRPSKRHSLDRIDNNGNYSPKNCRWATRKEQAGNKRDTRRIRAFGTTRILVEWARLSGLTHGLIHARLKHGWPAESAIAVGATNSALQKHHPAARHHKRTTRTHSRTSLSLKRYDRRRGISARARQTSIPYATLQIRLARGWTLKKALNTPVRPYGRPKC